MNPRLICVANNVFHRKWRVVADVMTRSLYSVINQHCGEVSFHYCLQQKLDLSYSQCRLFHPSSYLYKRRKTKEEKKMPKDYLPPPSKHKQKKVVEVWKDMTVKELANSMDMSVDDVLQVMEFVPNTENYYKPNSVIDQFGTLQLIIKLMGCRWILVTREQVNAVKVSKDVEKQPPPDPTVLVKRCPVVTVMGHVDHGKTTLLDTLRNTSVVEREFGGITQHIGAFSVQLDKNRRVTFLDTPGHAAFSSMRSRGARVTDIVVLVVAADDGVMAQTDESIRMARDAQVPIIVAINKIDKPQADIERTKDMLLQRGIQLEDAGGEVQAVPISALKGTNIDALVEAISVQSEVMELKGDPEGLCEGVVIESKQDPKRGKLATVIVQRGTLKKGTVLVAGVSWAKVKLMFDDNQKEVVSAAPSTPVEIMGWKELPSAGDIMLEVDSERRAREVIDWREKEKMLEKMEQDQIEIDMKEEEHNKEYQEKLLLKRRLGRRRLKPVGPREKEIKEDDNADPKLSIIIKGDVDGSVEAIIDILATYRSNLCKLDIVHFEVGNVTVNEVELADLFNAVIYTFNVDLLPDADKLANEKGVRVCHNNVIYKLIDNLKTDISKQLPPLDQEEVLGEAEVMQQFIVTEARKKVPVAGSRCTKGALKRNGLYKVIRNSEVIHRGQLQSMRHLKDEVDTIKKGLECGLRFDNMNINFEPGDLIVCYVIKKIEQQTDWSPGF